MRKEIRGELFIWGEFGQRRGDTRVVKRSVQEKEKKYGIRYKMKKEGKKWEDLARGGVWLLPGTGEASLWAQDPRDAGGNPCGQRTRLSTRSMSERQCRRGQ